VELAGGNPEIDALLGAERDDQEDESFKIEHVSAIFHEGESGAREITTATLGDLYFQQGQYDRAIRIFEKIAGQHPVPELTRKINACRVKLGVDRDALIRNKKIETLRAILKRVRTGAPL
jgi:lipopolysaccharide biosynthesis regulator YciM